MPPTFELNASNPAALDALRQYKGLARMWGAPHSHLDEIGDVEKAFVEWQEDKDNNKVSWDEPTED